jgi:dimeric dUTPase (all-alpha-NTP-PPase superfamily)
MKDIEIYKQTTCESCLSCCLLMLLNNPISQNDEINLFIEGIKRYPFSYSLGICEEFADKYDKDIIIYVHNKYYSKYLNTLKNENNVHIVQMYINKSFINKQEYPFVIYLDNNILEEYIHSPHFVIVESFDKTDYIIIDPWKGMRIKINKETLYKGVLLLKEHLKFCPLIIRIY